MDEVLELADAATDPDSEPVAGDPPEESGTNGSVANPDAVLSAANSAVDVGSRLSQKSDRRHETRYPFHWRAVVRRSSGRDLLGRTLDISMTGCCLVIEENFHPDQVIMLYLQLPPLHSGLKGDVISLDARVVRTTLSSRCGGFVLGIKFTKPGAADLLRLQKLLGNRTNAHF